MKNVTLEMSLKPFRKTDDGYIEAVCRKVFDQWKPLLGETQTISVMLWSADGSELLDYGGSLDDAFSWACFVGGANQMETEHSEIDPEGIGLHSRNYLYMENPPVMTYRILKNIVATIRRVGEEYFPNKKIRVGTTMDPGPEFSVSDFKYKRHPEICMGNDMGPGTMVCGYADLSADDFHYAAYPDGIPEGTPFGKFFGAQAQVFMDDMGFDYIWLSNGLGFGRDYWSACGAIFDGEKFDGGAINDVREKVMKFWKCFREGCSYPVEVRGTNMSVGIDFSTDAVPLKTIYDSVDNLLPPPNSPWAALNYDFGLELMGYMSRMANVPNDEYLFRFYIHDPWWRNSPWYDRYNRLPHDIYLPLSIARLDSDGNVKTPTHINFLTIDNSFGEMPEACANEPMSHILRGLAEAPDSVAPVVWVYPFDEYSECKDSFGLSRMYAEDWFICGAINNGLPLSMVVSTNNFIGHNKEIYAASIIVTPVPEAGSDFEKEILAYTKSGGKVIFYGSTKCAGKEFLDLLGIENEEGISGELDVCINGKPAGKTLHKSVICGGDLVSKSKNAFATAGSYAIGVKSGNCTWVSTTLSREYSKDSGYFICETLMNNALSMLGLEIVYERNADEELPVIMLHRHDNAYILSSFLRSTTVKTKIKTPLGAPILDGYDALIEDGYASYNFPKAERRECRVFVEQESGIVSCYEDAPVSFQIRRRITVKGLKNATVRFLAEEYCKDNIEAKLNSHRDFFFVGDDFDGGYVTKDGITYFEARNVTGTITFGMPDNKK